MMNFPRNGEFSIGNLHLVAHTWFSVGCIEALGAACKTEVENMQIRLGVDEWEL